MRFRGPKSAVLLAALLLLGGWTVVLTATAESSSSAPTIEFTVIPFTDKGGIDTTGTIEGKVTGARPDQLIVLYARSGAWYVQPFYDAPYTRLEPDLTWKNSTHLGTEYAALLVEPGYGPPNVTDALPQPGNGVVVVKIVPGTPFFWQTWWFRLVLVFAVVAVVILLLRARQQRVMRELNLKFEQRLAERTRIAQDLHDTLLQGLLSASMQLHVANEQLPPDSPAKPRVSRVLELMGQVIEEGRNAVRGLRANTADPLELEQAFARIQEELPTAQEIDYNLTAQGTSRPLKQAIRDEVYRVGHEALINAFRHAHATKIELEMQYTAKSFKVLVRDDGVGIDESVIEQGKEGHWGLSGMRERSQEIGGKLKVWSRAGAGTEVELTIPAQIAYDLNGSNESWLKRLVRRRRP
ncbi:MAG TPA: sensor histidine kinase [Pyrinomonadaceae bacterium]